MGIRENSLKQYNLIQQKIFRTISITSYLLIILMGQMIGLPFFFWLLFTLFDFGNFDQLFAFLAIVGLTIIFVNYNKVRTAKVLAIDLLCFSLLASPLVRRMTAVPIELFNYLSFIIPTTLFVLFYAASLFFGCRQYSRIKAGLGWRTKNCWQHEACRKPTSCWLRR